MKRRPLPAGVPGCSARPWAQSPPLTAAVLVQLLCFCATSLWRPREGLEAEPPPGTYQGQALGQDPGPGNAAEGAVLPQLDAALAVTLLMAAAEVAVGLGRQPGSSRGEGPSPATPAPSAPGARSSPCARAHTAGRCFGACTTPAGCCCGRSSCSGTLSRASICTHWAMGQETHHPCTHHPLPGSSGAGRRGPQAVSPLHPRPPHAPHLPPGQALQEDGLRGAERVWGQAVDGTAVALALLVSPAWLPDALKRHSPARSPVPGQGLQTQHSGKACPLLGSPVSPSFKLGFPEKFLEQTQTAVVLAGQCWGPGAEKGNVYCEPRGRG